MVTPSVWEEKLTYGRERERKFAPDDRSEEPYGGQVHGSPRNSRNIVVPLGSVSSVTYLQNSNGCLV